VIIVADSSPMIGLGRINQLDLLNRLFKNVLIPPAVAAECTYDLKKPGAKSIQAAIDQSLIQIYDGKFERVKNLSRVLGLGEIEAISLALSLDAPLLIDEKKARSSAQQFGIDIIGVDGVLIAAKKQKILPSIKPLLDELQTVGYRISSDLYKTILEYSNE